MKIGILNDSDEREKRVSLLPEGVKTLSGVNEILVEKGAGAGVRFSDEDYEAAGARIVSRDEVFEAELVLKITPPTDEDIEKIRPGTVWMGLLFPLSNPELLRKFNEKQATVFSLDTIPRITRAQAMDVLSSMSTIAGYKAVLLAANHLPRFLPMLTTAAGTIRPARALVIGAGVAGLQAIATAKRLGAVAEAFDTRPSVKEQVESLGGKFIEVEGAREDTSAGGYAVEQTEDFKKRQQEALEQQIQKADLVITTALIPGKQAPVLISKEMVENMKSGAVIVDIAAGSGGNCALTEDQQTVTHNDITVIGHSNLPATLPQDASRMYGKNVLNFLRLLINDDGGLNLDFNDAIIEGTCNAHGGEILHSPTLEKLNS